MRRLIYILLLFSINVMACGPNPQKVVEKIVIKGTPEMVWSVVGDFERLHQWHPDVINTMGDRKLDSAGNVAVFRTLQLKNGGKLIERLRETQAGEMKLGTVMDSGDMAVSNYSDALTVSTTMHSNETEVTWTGRFNNKANLLVAPADQDNNTAIAAVQQFYQHGLNGLKAYIETVQK